jgi:hypothetical protein
MSSPFPTSRLAAATFLLACAPTFAAHLTGVVRDASGEPVAGALVVASSETDVKDANGATHRWIANSDAAGRFAFDGFPAGRCHVTANAGGGRAGVAAGACVTPAGDAVLEQAIVVHAQPGHATGHVRRPSDAKVSADDVTLFARVPVDDDPALVIFGARIVDNAWAVDLPPGAWMTKAVLATGESRLTQFALPGQKTPIELTVAPNHATHPEIASELKAMVAKDQDARNKAIATGRQDAATFKPVQAVDRVNLARLKQVIKRHGWPTADLVGNDGMGDFWLLAQHAPPAFIASALPHLKAAADRGEIGWSVLALTIDRDLVNRKKPQIYGSQGTIAQDGHFILFDVEDPAHLDERRASVGLGPIADYKALIEKDYRKPGSAS